MAYTKQTWVDGVTPINAERMNHIENGIKNSEANSYFVFIQEGESVTKEFLLDIDERYADGINIVGVTSGGPRGLLYSNSFNRSTQLIGGTTWTTIVFRFLDDRSDESGEGIFGYQSMSATFRGSDDPSTEYTWNTEYEPIISVSDANNMALVVSTEFEGESYTFNDTWQNINDKNYTTVRIENEIGVVHVCPIVGVGPGNNGLYYVYFLTYATGEATVKIAWSESADGYPSWNTRE